MKNGVGDSDPSPVVDVPQAPGKPQNLNCKHNDLCYQVTISWERPTINPEAATRYELQRQEDEHGQWVLETLEKKVIDGVFTAVVKGLNPRTKYNFRLCAVNDANGLKGEFCETSSTTKIEIPGDPQKVVDITRRLTCIELGWNALTINPDHVKYYAVHICKVEDKKEKNKWQSLDLLPSNCLSIAIEGLEENTYYHVIVRALNQEGDGGEQYIKVSTTYAATETLKLFKFKIESRKQSPASGRLYYPSTFQMRH